MSSTVSTNTFHNSQKLLYNIDYGPKELMKKIDDSKRYKRVENGFLV